MCWCLSYSGPTCHEPVAVAQLARGAVDDKAKPTLSDDVSDADAFLDDRKRKFIIGDHDGHILVYNFQSGVMMKALDSHSGQVSGLVYKTMSKAVLSVSWDRAVVVHDEAMRERGKIIRIMDPVQQHHDDITALACMEGTFF